MAETPKLELIDIQPIILKLEGRYKPSRGRPISDLMIMPSYLDVALCQYGHWSLGFYR